MITSELQRLSTEFGYGNGIEYIQESSKVLKTVLKILDEGGYDEIRPMPVNM